MLSDDDLAYNGSAELHIVQRATSYLCRLLRLAFWLACCTVPLLCCANPIFERTTVLLRCAAAAARIIVNRGLEPLCWPDASRPTAVINAILLRQSDHTPAQQISCIYCLEAYSCAAPVMNGLPILLSLSSLIKVPMIGSKELVLGSLSSSRHESTLILPGEVIKAWQSTLRRLPL